MDGSAGHWCRLHSRTEEVTPSTESTPPLRFSSCDYIGALLSERDYENHLFGYRRSYDSPRNTHKAFVASTIDVTAKRHHTCSEDYDYASRLGPQGLSSGGFETANRATILNSEVAVMQRLHHVAMMNARPRFFDGDAVNSRQPEAYDQLLSRETAMKTFGVHDVISADPKITAESLKRRRFFESNDAFGDKDEPREPKKPRLDVQHCGTGEPMDFC
ncbi:hypothetical protein MRX96_010454 [Rhipicephalus microplus]